MNLDEQIEVFDRYAHIATTVLVGKIVQRRDELIALARERMSGIGFDTYGATGWERSAADAASEIDDELADAIVYVCQEMYQRTEG